MKKKLILTIDEDVARRAQRYARGRGVSLSSLVEDALARIIRFEDEGFVERWRGAFEPRDPDTTRFRSLSEKYL